MTEDLYIGMLSGTSRDGVDAVLVNFSDGSMDLLHATCTAYPPAIKMTLDQLLDTGGKPSADVVSLLDDGEATLKAAKYISIATACWMKILAVFLPVRRRTWSVKLVWKCGISAPLAPTDKTYGINPGVKTRLPFNWVEVTS